MLKTIFNLGEPSLLPSLCAVGECLDPDTSSCRKCEDRGKQAHTNWWATGILIHPRVVLTVAHSPRSATVLGDRVLLPKIDGKALAAVTQRLKGGEESKDFPERVLCVQRIYDHSKVTQRGYDARLLILMDVKDIEGELEDRRCSLENYDSTMHDFRIDGFTDLTGPPPSLPTRTRTATKPADADEEKTHGHLRAREFVITPEKPKAPGGGGKTAAFGDSGAPVWIPGADPDGKARVVGMYVRRSRNRPAMGNPDLVILQWKEDLQEWLDDVLDRHPEEP